MNESSGDDAVAEAHRGALETLRTKAMEWIDRLGPGAKAASQTEDFDRLVGKNDGVIDAFNIAAQIALRVIEKEREVRGLAAADVSQLPYEQELDRLIAAELDRIAAARGPAAFSQTDGAFAEIVGAAPVAVEGMERAA